MGDGVVDIIRRCVAGRAYLVVATAVGVGVEGVAGRVVSSNVICGGERESEVFKGVMGLLVASWFAFGVSVLDVL